MAGSEGSKYYNIFLKYQIWLESRDGKDVVCSEFFTLMKLIQKHGSIVAAAEAMGISFRKAWKLVKDSEVDLNMILIERSRGGKTGGKSELSAEGHKLIEAYDELIIEFNKAIHSVTKKFFGVINK